MAIVLILAAGPSPVDAAPPQVPVARAAMALLKILTLERSRSNARVVVGFVYAKGDAASKSRAEGMKKAIKEASRSLKIHGAKPRAVLLPESDLAANIASRGITIVHLSPGVDIKMIVQIATNHQIPTCSGRVSDIERKGVVLGVYAERGRLRIAVNLINARKIGMKFHSGLFRFAKVFK